MLTPKNNLKLSRRLERERAKNEAMIRELEVLRGVGGGAGKPKVVSRLGAPFTLLKLRHGRQETDVDGDEKENLGTKTPGTVRRPGKPARFAKDGTPFKHAKRPELEPVPVVEAVVESVLFDAKSTAGGMSFLV